MLSELFKDSGVETKAKSAGLDDLEWRQFLAYAAGVFANMGNYRSFGDTKIIPEVA